jgi:hypothetical protein
VAVEMNNRRHGERFSVLSIFASILSIVIGCIALMMFGPVLFFTKAPTPAITSFNIRVVDAQSGEPISQAKVNIDAPDIIFLVDNSHSMTDEDGSASFQLRKDAAKIFVRIFIQSNGYRDFSSFVELQPNGPRPIEIALIELSGTSLIPPVPTPNPTQLIQQAFSEVDSQFKNMMKSNIAFIKPSSMVQEETTSVELILNPSMSASVLAGQLENQAGLATSTAEPGQLISPNGMRVVVETGEIEITPRMKTVLLAQDPDAFVIKEMHDNAEQVVSSAGTTTWRWSVTAKKEGQQTLELIVYQLVKYDGKEYWHDVETYRANIPVQVSVSSWLKSLDWKWVASALLIPFVIAVWGWLRNQKKKAEEEKPVQTALKGKKKRSN